MATFLSLRSSGQTCRQITRLFTRKYIISRSNSTVSQAAKEQLNWPEYLAIRGQKRKWETVLEPRLISLQNPL